MRLAIVPSVMLLSVAGSALAQLPPPRHADNGDWAAHPDDSSDGPGNCLEIDLNVFREAGVYSTDSVFTSIGTASGAPTAVGGFISTLQPLVLVGYHFDQNSLLLGIGVASQGGVNGQGGGIFFGVSPTYRRYLSPLRTGKLNPFAEGGVTFSISAPNGGGSSSWGLGVDVGAGAEWLFVRNFGLFAKALVTYGHLNLASTSGTVGGGSATLNLDAVGLEGDVGLTVHF